MAPRRVRIFISSPSDVALEREQARRVIEGLQRRYPDVVLESVLWEDLALPATSSFQAGIDSKVVGTVADESSSVATTDDKPTLSQDASFDESVDLILRHQQIDIAVFILWSRLGSPLGPSITKSDRRNYRSGTQREFDLMLAAFEKVEISGP